MLCRSAIATNHRDAFSCFARWQAEKVARLRNFPLASTLRAVCSASFGRHRASTGRHGNPRVEVSVSDSIQRGRLHDEY